ncbi:MAG: VacB/RNase II family 3'-5' exoribonuclease [Lentisphaeria bacterium]|nr:VacB/RNase II family 3'-5' exoribonuclease [Lentisphaeria bacterium]
MGKKRKNKPEPRLDEGIFCAAAGGFGFVERPGGETVFIPAPKVRNAVTGDRVSVRITDPAGRQNLGPVGEIAGVLSRGRKYVTGELLPGRTIRPLDEHFNGKVKITGSVRGIRVGDWVRVRLLDSGPKFTEALRGEIVERIGETGSVAADLLAVAAEFNLPDPYSEEDNRAAEKLKPRPIGREDLLDRFTVTVDPEDAKDFDDAISLSEGAKPGTVELGVHIADVAAWVPAGKKFDRKAAERGFSAYLPGRYLPMLPGSLTSRISLREGAESPAHSVLFTIRETTGRILAVRRIHSRIKVDKRLDYDELQDFIEHPRRLPEGWTPVQRDRIARLVRLVRRMRGLRLEQEHPLQIETCEVRVLCDSETMTLTGLRKNLSREAEQLVEECMLAANSAVANELIERKVPGIFRVHAPPQEAKLDDFSRTLQTDFRLASGDLSDRSVCERFLQNLPDDPRKPVILSNFLRSLPRAVYAAEPAFHYGLGKYRYAHFTSPIRRYTDLLVHRQLWALDTNGKLMSKDVLAEQAQRCSGLEERNDNAYFAANDRLKLHYLHRQDDPGKEYPAVYEAVIARLMPAGVLCSIEDLGLFGFIPAEKLQRAGVRFNHRSRRFRAGRGHAMYKCGDIVYVVLDSLDFVRGRAVFRPV